jgi:hypothetical protein
MITKNRRPDCAAYSFIKTQNPASIKCRWISSTESRANYPRLTGLHNSRGAGMPSFTGLPLVGLGEVEEGPIRAV